MKKVLVFSAALLFLASASFAASKTADTVSSSISVKNVKTLHDAIIKGCEERGWVPSKSANENEIIATLDNRGHQVVVSIPYDKNGYRIIYKSSKNMNYNPKTKSIHPKYNQWSANLDKSIKSNIDFKKEME